MKIFDKTKAKLQDIVNNPKNKEKLQKISDQTTKAKDTVVDFVSEENADKKRVPKEWVKTTGKVIATIGTIYAAKKGYDKIKGESDNKINISSFKFDSIDKNDTSLDNLIKASSEIENIIESKGGEGRGLHEKLSSIENFVQQDSAKSIRFIASIRNKLVHQGPDSVSTKSKRAYLIECEKVLNDLKCNPNDLL
jgi:hypothetical protein